MYTVLGALAGVLLLTGLAFAADETKARSPQAERMTTCNAEARDRKLAGDERRHFMSECLKGHTSSTDAAPQAGKASQRKSSEGEAHSSQTEKMKTCNQEAAAKKLQGDDRRHFMSECLRAEKKS
jgi:psiF repeat-containing protein